MQEQKERKKKRKKERKKKKPRKILECRMQEWKKNILLSYFSPPPLHIFVTINRFKVFLSSISCLPFYPIGRKYLPHFPPTPSSIPTSSNQLMICKDPYPAPCTLGIKMHKGPLFNTGSPLKWPAILTVSSTLINFISFSFCLMSVNSFPTCVWTTTVT